MSALWNFVTDFGDTAVTLPLAVVMAGFLVAARQPRLSLGWVIAIIGCAVGTGVLKIVLAACGYPLGGPGEGKPSGHTAMSIAVYGGYAAVVAANLARPARELAVAAAGTLIVGIAVSRVILGVHSPLEVGIGLLVGTATVSAIVALVAWLQRGELPIHWLILPVLAVTVRFHGERWPAEQAIDWLVDLFRPWCSWL